MPFEWILNACLAFSGQAILTFALVKMLRLRHLAIIWATAFFPCIITGYLNSYPVDPRIKASWSLGSFIVTVWMYWAFSGVKPMQRLVTISCCIAAAFVSEFPLAAIFLSMGFSIDDISAFVNEHLEVYFFYLVLHSAVISILLLLVNGLMDRLFSEDGERGGVKAILPPTAQLCLILVVSFAEREIVKEDESFMLFTAFLAVIVLAGYAFFYFAVRYRYDAELKEARVRNLREQSEQTFRQVEGFISETERLAKLRHDLKNQLQVVELLNSDGEREQALDRLGCLEAAVKHRAARP